MRSFPAIHSTVHTHQYNSLGDVVYYLKSPGVVMIAQPAVDLYEVQTFLDGFDKKLKFEEYLQDTFVSGPESLCKFAGQLCYLSFGPKRTWNSNINNYFTHIKESGHGSVLEHANFSFLIYGVSRSFTHELVRHRAGAAFSQVSQRYVDGSKLRFVERAEFQNNRQLHDMFLNRITAAALEYSSVADILMTEQSMGLPLLSAEHKTDLRKKVNQAAREVLPNEVEAPIVVTLNARSLRHVLEMRGAAAAEIQIRNVAYMMYECVVQVAPVIFDDYKVEDLPDGTKGLTTDYRKV